MTGTGAFLLVAAAAVFVAVQWDHLSNEVKLAVLATVTGAFLLAGRRLRASLPATSGVLSHLGAFLIPANTAAVALHLQLEWPPFLLLEGVTATAAWAVLGRAERSPVLRWATGAAVVVAAAGLGAVTHTPTAVLLVLCAAGAEVAGWRRAATGWALVAGFAPAIAAGSAGVPAGAVGTIETLGLSGRPAQVSAAAVGVVAAAIVGRNAQRRRDLVLAACAGAVLVLGVATAWAGVQPPAEATGVGLACTFLLLELTAHLLRRDPFWAPPLRAVAVGAEIAVAVVTPAALWAGMHALIVGAAWAPAPGHDSAGAIVLGAALTTFAWFVADLRRSASDGRRGGGRTSGTGLAVLIGGAFAPATVLGPAALLAGLACATGSVPVVGVAAVAAAAFVILGGRPLGHVTATVLVVGAATLASADVRVEPPSSVRAATAVALAAAGALLLAWIATIRASMGGDESGALAWTAAVTAVLVLELGSIGARELADPFAVLVGLAVAGFALAWVLDRHQGAGDVRWLGWVGRAAALLTLLQGWVWTGGGGRARAGAPHAVLGLTLSSAQLAALASVLVALAAAEAAVRRRPTALFTLAISVPVAVAATASLRMGTGAIGLALCVTAAVAAGFELILPRRWSPPALATVVSCAAAGLACATETASTTSTAVLVLAGIAMAYAVVHRSIEGIVAAAVAATVGVWGHLRIADVTALDAYLAPIAVGLIVAGWQARTPRPFGRLAGHAPAAPTSGVAPDGAAPGLPSPVSSWVAYAPGIILLGGSALLERVDGGGGAHALVAGAVGVLAVLAGGSRRLIAPLLLGTALLIGLTVTETLSVTRAVPTWGWLALGGSVLVAAGIAMERAETGPVESGRRLVDVVQDRFT